MNSVTKTVKTIVQETVLTLQKELNSHANPQTKIFVENYMKNVSKYRGVKSGDLKTLVWKDFWAEKIKPMELEDQKELAHELLSQEHGEDRYLGMLLFDKIKKNIDLDDIKKVEGLMVFAGIFSNVG